MNKQMYSVIKGNKLKSGKGDDTEQRCCFYEPWVQTQIIMREYYISSLAVSCMLLGMLSSSNDLKQFPLPSFQQEK